MNVYPEGPKNDTDGVLEGSKIEVTSRLEVSWALLGASSGTWRHMLANSSEVGATIGEAGAKLAASCDQDGARYP